MKPRAPTSGQGAFAFMADAPALSRCLPDHRDNLGPHLLAGTSQAACWRVPRRAPAAETFTGRALEVRCPKCRRSDPFKRLTRVRAASLSSHEGHLPDGTPIVDLELPERLLVMSFWGRWLDLILAGIKRIETREWAWPYPPGWLGLHASLRYDGPLGDDTVLAENIPDVPRGRTGMLVAIAWIDGCRRLVPEDLPRALVYGPKRFAWELGPIHVIAHPIAMPGAQKLKSLPRAQIEAALVA